MVKEIWINLPVKDAKKTREFYSQIGFRINEQNPMPNSTSFFVGTKNVVFMMIEEPIFKSFVSTNLSDSKQSAEVLFSIDAESREEVDEMAKKVDQAGGIIFGKPAENQGWLYGFGFTDPDGHRWNMLYMDFSKMPK